MAAHVVKAILFDTFGSVVDWRRSLIASMTAWADRRGLQADWARLVDDWRGAYVPSMDRVRRGDLPWTDLDGLHRASLERLVEEYGIDGMAPADLDELTLCWHRLQPWPDAIPGLTRLKAHRIIAPLSNGNVALLLDMAKHAGLPWDMIFGADLFQHYKPDPETYEGAVALLRLRPGEVMMAAAHNGDLAAARQCGLRTAFFARPTEYGSSQRDNLRPTEDWDIIASDVEDLATQLGS